MFQSARIKLTIWYLLIIMCVSVFFSVSIYKLVDREYDRVEQYQKIRLDRQKTLHSLLEEFRRQRKQEGLEVPPLPEVLEPQNLNEARTRLQIILFLVNFSILAISGVAGYFLAGRTLKPIKEMVDEQNRFIADSSHELRTPITSLKTEIEVNLRDKNLSRETRQILESNLKDVNSLQILSDSLIKLAQYQKGNNNFAFQQASLSGILTEAQKKVVILAKHKGIKIHTDIRNRKIKGDEKTLIELFVIILDNAIKYSPKNTTIEISASRVDGFVKVDVKDQGVGIKKEDIIHLFDRFYRADKSRTKNSTQGYGLGLSIAKQIAEKHNGKISVESEIEKGTTISVLLPKL